MLFYHKLLVCIILLMYLFNFDIDNASKVTTLSDFQTLSTYEDSKLAQPQMIKVVDSTSYLVYDSGYNQVKQLNLDGEIIQEYGREGEGPGEYSSVLNLFITDDQIYVLDQVQGKILKYDHQGEFLSSFNYDPTNVTSPPPPPPAPSEELASKLDRNRNNINNQPYVGQSGNVLLPSDHEEYLFELKDWEGEFQAHMGGQRQDIQADMDEFRSDITNSDLPDLFSGNSFPVQDRNDPQAYFLIYSSFPVIARYQADGQQEWEVVPDITEELKELEEQYFESARQLLEVADGVVIHRKYTTGASNTEGELFLATFTNAHHPMWIHRFSNSGELQQQYKIESDVDLIPHFDIDPKGEYAYVITEEAEIRRYNIDN